MREASNKKREIRVEPFSEGSWRELVKRYTALIRGDITKTIESIVVPGTYLDDGSIKDIVHTTMQSRLAHGYFKKPVREWKAMAEHTRKTRKEVYTPARTRIDSPELFTHNKKYKLGLDTLLAYGDADITLVESDISEQSLCAAVERQLTDRSLYAAAIRAGGGGYEKGDTQRTNIAQLLWKYTHLGDSFRRDVRPGISSYSMLVQQYEILLEHFVLHLRTHEQTLGDILVRSAQQFLQQMDSTDEVSRTPDMYEFLFTSLGPRCKFNPESVFAHLVDMWEIQYRNKERGVI